MQNAAFTTACPLTTGEPVGRSHQRLQCDWCLKTKLFPRRRRNGFRQTRKAGFPVLTLSSDHDSKHLVLSQPPFRQTWQEKLQRILKPLRPSQYDREIIRIAVPAVGTVIINPLLSFVDTMFVGRLGLEAVSAMQPCTNFYFVIYSVVGAVIHVAGSVMVTQSETKGDANAVTSAVLVVTAVALLVAIVGTIALTRSPAFFLRIMGAKGETLKLAAPYLAKRVLGLPAGMLTVAGDAFLLGLKDTRTPLYVAILVGVANLILDPLLMFGPPKMGFVGAAYATAIAQWIGLFLFVFAFWKRRHVFGLTDITRQRILNDTKRFFRAGSSVLIRQIANTACWSSMGAIATLMGKVERASYQFATNIFFVPVSAVDAVGVSPMIMVPRAKVKSGVKRAREIAERSLGLTAQVALAMVFAYFLILSPQIGRLLNDRAAEELTSKLLAAAFLGLVPGSLVWVWDSIMFSVNDFGHNARSLVFSSAIAVTVMYTAFFTKVGLVGIWTRMTFVFYGMRFMNHAWRFYFSRSSPLALHPQSVHIKQTDAESTSGNGTASLPSIEFDHSPSDLSKKDA